MQFFRRGNSHVKKSEYTQCYVSMYEWTLLSSNMKVLPYSMSYVTKRSHSLTINVTIAIGIYIYISDGNNHKITYMYQFPP